MRFYEFKIVETNARLQKRFNDWMGQYVTWQELKNQTTTTSMVGDMNVTSQAFDQSMQDQKAQLDQEAEFLKKNGFQDQVDNFLNDMTKPLQRAKVDPVPGIAMPKVRESMQLNEGARIDHAEDVVFWEGSRGAARAIESLKNLEQGGHKDVTIKWDGSPAVIFGRNADGEFTLTDKSGFGAKGYDGKPKTAKDIEQMFLGRKERKGIEPDENYKSFAANMRSIYDEYENAVPKDFVGYFKGDLLYYNRPPVEDKQFVFKPQMVTYRVGVDSPLGQKINKSTTGVVVHQMMNEDGSDSPLPQNYLDIFQGDSVLVFPSITVEKPAQVNDSKIKRLQQIVAKDSAAIDSFLDVNTLTELKMKDVPNILYNYMNQKVDTGLSDINTNNFIKWLAGSSVSKVKQTRLIDYISQNRAGLDAIWEVVNGIMEVKNDIIDQFDSHDSEVSASIGDQKGGEGYVLANPQGSIKLVNRAGFTAANRAVQR